MVHDELDIDRWIREFPLEALRTEARAFVIARRDRLPGEYKTDRDFNAHIGLMYPKAEAIVGPRSIAVLEQLRQERLGGRYGGRMGDADVFVWARGEPANRAVTKVGGLPYWRESRPWPVSSENEPLEFIAQICFADSAEIAGSLPNDILLLFGHPDALIEEPPELVFRWESVGLRAEALTARLPVEVENSLEPFFGVMHRSEDWLESPDEDMALIEGTKIGGVPRWIQAEDPQPGRFIATLGSIPIPEGNYPFVNVPEPMRARPGRTNLMIGDVGSLFLFVDDSGDVRATSQCY